MKPATIEQTSLLAGDHAQITRDHKGTGVLLWHPTSRGWDRMLINTVFSR
jgi:hypothetical protein